VPLGGGDDQEDWPNIYIDESVAPGGDGSQADPYSDFSEINWTTGGDNSVFDYYAGSPATSVTINLKRGETWAVKLDVQESGTATYPLIVQAYGSGADPIIDIEGVITGWDTGGNWGADSTQSTFNPDADPETSSVDGYVNHVSAEDSWANIHGGVGTGVNETSYLYARISSDGISPNYYWIRRGILTFNTATIPDGESVTAATLSLYGNTLYNDFAEDPSVNIYLAAPANSNALAAGDYNSLGTTAYCDTPITHATFVTNDYNDFLFNATGRAAISNTVASCFGLREVNMDVANSAPTWAADSTSGFKFWDADNDDNGKVPKLVVTHGMPNVWKIDLATTPSRLWLDGTEYIEAENKAGITSTYRWWYDATNTDLYVYATENPSTAYTTMTHRRTDARSIRVSNQDYITIKDLDVRGGFYAVEIRYGSTYVTVDDCTLGKYSLIGIRVNGSNCEVKNCAIDSGMDTSAATWRTDLSDGILIAGATYNANSNLIHDNTVTDWGHTGITVENEDAAKTANSNEIYLNTITAPNSNYCRAFGMVEGAAGVVTSNKFYRNTCYNLNVASQLKCNGNEVYNNLFYDFNANYAGYCNGLDIGNDCGNDVKTNHVDNNVFYNIDGYAIYVYGGYGDIENNLIRNNLIMLYNVGAAADDCGIRIVDDVEILGNTYQNNLIYMSGDGTPVRYRGDGELTITEFNAENGSNSDVIGSNLGSDPHMIDPANGDFTLQGTSPCIDAGVDVGLTTDYAGNSVPYGAGVDLSLIHISEPTRPY